MYMYARGTRNLHVRTSKRIASTPEQSTRAHEYAMCTHEDFASTCE